MIKRIAILVAFLCHFTLVTAQVEKGDLTATTNLTFTTTEGSTLGIFLLKGGYFVSNHVEIGSSLQLFFIPGDTGVGLGPYATYNFLTQDAKLLPYAGAQLSVLSLGDFNMNSFGIYGGSKYFLTEAVNVDAGIVLAQGFGDIDGLVFTASIGIGVILGKLR
jgi:hypothetical protein